MKENILLIREREQVVERERKAYEESKGLEGQKFVKERLQIAELKLEQAKTRQT